MRHELSSVHTIEGAQRWARSYTSLHERLALELEDLTVRRPRLRTCPLCQRLFIALRPGQTLCSNQLWEGAGRLLRRCAPPSEAASYDAAAAALHRKRRKTAWTAMNRARRRDRDDPERTAAAAASAGRASRCRG
jgi:hypothetical protein